MKVKIYEVFKAGDLCLAKAWFTERSGGIIAIKEHIFQNLMDLEINKPANKIVLNSENLLDQNTLKSLKNKNPSIGQKLSQKAS